MVGSERIRSESIDEYANSMFRFERLHDRWVESCTRYLRFLFGDRIRQATVLDYAFGRGNWSVAFRRAGAARVIAIDASRHNVARFSEYLAARRVDGIEVIHGNVLESPLDLSADVLWVYGILHHVREVDEFLSALRPMTRGESACAYFYAYDRGSLRELVVETCRRFARYETESEFRADSFSFTPAARRRVQDDLTAPHIRWYSAVELADLLRAHGFFVGRQDQDFPAHLRGAPCEEFQPHQFLCELSSSRDPVVVEPARPHAADVALLAGLVMVVVDEGVDSREASPTPTSPPSRPPTIGACSSRTFSFSSTRSWSPRRSSPSCPHTARRSSSSLSGRCRTRSELSSARRSARSTVTCRTTPSASDVTRRVFSRRRRASK